PRSGASRRRYRFSGCSSCTASASINASSATVPEWLATISAAPLSGMFSTPRTDTRNQSRYSGRSNGCSTVSVSSRSKPNSSTSYSPVSRRRRKARAPATRRSHTSGSGGSGGGATARRLRSGAGRGWAAARLSKSVMGVSPRSGPAAPQPGQDALLGGADRLAGQYAADATQEVLERDRGRARDHAGPAGDPAG